MPENELHPELLGLTGFNSFAAHNSSSRGHMSSSHLSQHLVTCNPDEKRVQSGMEQELAKTTFSIKMPDDGSIIAVIDRYPASAGKDSLNYNPETIVIFERETDKRLDYISIPHFCSHHQFFGFEYTKTDKIYDLVPGSHVAKDTIFADSPAVSENNGYKYGHNLNTAFMSVPGVAEDGFVISESALEKMKFKLFERRVVEVGSKTIPLNIHGSIDNYKIFPDIGDYINDTRSDGLLMMTRDNPDNMAPGLLSIYDLTEPDFTFDKGTYVRGGKGKVIDIKVISNNSRVKNLPPQMTEQLEKYSKAYLTFHRELVAVEKRLIKQRRRKFGDKVRLDMSPKLHALLVESHATMNKDHPKDNQPLNLLYRQEPVDEYRVEIVIEYEMRPDIGGKITSTSGGKGVICKIMKDEDMPVDANGNRAEVLVDPTSIISRINMGTLYEHYVNSASRDIRHMILNKLNIPVGKCSVDLLMDLPKVLADEVYAMFLKYLECVSEKQFAFYSTLDTEQRLEAITDIVNDDIYTYIPTNNSIKSVDMVKALEATFDLKTGPVTYRGESGNIVTTKANIRIAPLYFMLLDKIADNWTSVSTGKLQHFGVLTPLTKSEKYSLPYRNSATRTMGETETRIMVGYCGPEAVAEVMDRSNNPQTQKNIIWNILNADKPTDIEEVVDRDFIPLGNGKNIQLVKHMLSCAGMIPVYEPENK